MAFSARSDCSPAAYALPPRFIPAIINATFPPCHATRVSFQTLCEAYAEGSHLDDGGMPFVRYKGLLEEVEGVFGVRELERQPECDVDASVHAAQVGNRGPWMPTRGRGRGRKDLLPARENRFKDLHVRVPELFS